MHATTPPMESTLTTCPYCGVGCGVDARGRDGEILSVAGDREHPANLGRLCVKGSALHETTGLEGRLLHPRVAGLRVDWPTAIDTVAQGFSRVVAQHGPGAVAFYLSGQLLTEDYYVANKLMKGFIGSANVDTNSRLCMSSAVAGYKRAFGADAVPCSYQDLELCDLLVITGSNAAWTHPVLYQRIAEARRRRPWMRVVVIDPRVTVTCDIADLHLAIAPGSDAFLFAGLLRHLHESGAVDHGFVRRHTRGLEDALAAACSSSEAAARCGLPTEHIERFYHWFATLEKTVTFYSQGVNQSATGSDKCNAIINCHLATGRIGRPGMGPFSITGQPNAMGGREVGGLANQLAAHMDFSPEDIDRVGRFWSAPNMAVAPGLKAVELFDAMDRGEVKAVWIMATNPVVSLPDADRVRRALSRCELVVVSDCMADTDTARHAHVLLPAAGWGEKDGTVTNSERRISRQRALRPASGEARDDWWIISRVAQRMGFQQAFDYHGPHGIFVEHAALSGFENRGSRAFDISALATLGGEDYDRLAPVQWPVNGANPAGTERLFGDGRFFTPDGRARLVPVTPTLPERTADGHFPFILNSGRVRDQWHTMTRTALAPRLLNHTDAPYVAINPHDAATLGLEEGGLAEVFNGQGRVRLEVRIDNGLASGQVFAPIHWSDTFAAAARVSTLFAPITDPLSGQPQSKFAPVALRPLAVARWLQVLSRRPLDVAEFDHWVRVPVSGGHRYLLALASDNSLDPRAWLAGCAEGAQFIEFEDAASGLWRALATNDDRLELLVFAARLRRDLPEPVWLGQQLGRTLDHKPWPLLAGRDPGGEDRGRLICSCFEVGELSIRRAIAGGCDSPQALGASLRCGTNCGSCVPELKRLIGDVAAGGDAQRGSASRSTRQPQKAETTPQKVQP